MLMVMMVILGIVSIVLTEVFLLFPSHLFSGFQIPNWIGLVLILVLLSWCMGDKTD